MKRYCAIILISSFTWFNSATAKPKELQSPRSEFTLFAPVKWNAAVQGIDVITIYRNKNKDSKDRLTLILDTKGVRTVTSSAEFPLKVTVSRPTDEFPFTLIVFESQKEGIQTDLIDAIAVRSGVARFLSKQEYRKLAGTHRGIPKVIEDLNKELNDLPKK